MNWTHCWADITVVVMRLPTVEAENDSVCQHHRVVVLVAPATNERQGSTHYQFGGGNNCTY